MTSQDLAVNIDDDYACFFTTFLNCTDEKDLGPLEKCIKKLAKKHTFSNPTTLNVLSLGSGSGRADSYLLNYLSSFVNKSQTIHYSAVEMNQILFNQFEERVRELKEVMNLKLQQLAMSVEDFVQHAALQEAKTKYDLIFASHYFYYSKDMKKTLEILLESLTPTGKIVVIVHAPAGIDLIHRLFAREGFNPSLKKVQCNCYQVEEAYKSIQHDKGLENLEVSIMTTESFIDISKCLIPGNREGRELMSFFVEKSLLKYTEEEIAPLVDYLRTISTEITNLKTGSKSYKMFQPTSCVVAGFRQQ